MNGFIMLHRQLLEWEWYSDSNVKAVFIDMLLRANFKDGKFKGRDIKRGQLVIGVESFGNRLGLTRQETRTCIKKLKKTNEILTFATSKFLIVTIVNFDLYQSQQLEEQPASNQQLINKQPSTNHQLTINQPQRNKENKENKKNKEIINTSECVFENDSKTKPSKKFTPPTIQEIENYCIEKGWKTSFAQIFLDGNLQSDWTLANGKKMKDWKAACRTWMSKEYNYKYIDKSSTAHQVKVASNSNELKTDLPIQQQDKYYNSVATALRIFFKEPSITDKQKAGYQVMKSIDFANQFKIDHPKIFEQCLKEYHERILKSL